MSSRTDAVRLPDGTEFELTWSRDESVVRLTVSALGRPSRFVLLTPTQLDALRKFISERLQ